MSGRTIHLVTCLAIVLPVAGVSQEPRYTGSGEYIVEKSYFIQAQKVDELVADFDTREKAEKYASELNNKVRLGDPWTFTVTKRKRMQPGDPGPLNPGPTRPSSATPDAKSNLSQAARKKLEPAYKAMSEPWMEEVIKLASDILKDGDDNSLDMLKTLREEFKMKSEAIEEGRDLLDRGQAIATIDTRKSRASDPNVTSLRRRDGEQYKPRDYSNDPEVESYRRQPGLTQNPQTDKSKADLTTNPLPEIDFSSPDKRRIRTDGVYVEVWPDSTNLCIQVRGYRFTSNGQFSAVRDCVSATSSEKRSYSSNPLQFDNRIGKRELSSRKGTVGEFTVVGERVHLKASYYDLPDEKFFDIRNETLYWPGSERTFRFIPDR